MPEKAENKPVEFECPCEKKLTLFKFFDLVAGTPPEDVLTNCPACDKKIKVPLDNQLKRDQDIFRGN